MGTFIGVSAVVFGVLAIISPVIGWGWVIGGTLLFDAAWLTLCLVGEVLDP